MTAQTILPANTLSSGGYDVANSLRFDQGSSPYLRRSLGTTTSQQKGTFSYWVKRSDLADSQQIYSNEVANDNNRGYISFESNDSWRAVITASGTDILVKTNRLFRDTSAWYHIVVRIDTTQGTAANRLRLYVNGVQETSFETYTICEQNNNLKLLEGGQSNKNLIGGIYASGNASNYLGGYLSEFVYCDGQTLDPTSFGEFDEDSGIWKPIDVSGLTFGNMGFHLDFEDSSDLGNDAVGDNNWSVVNLAAIDQSTDTCTNNFATLNSLNVPTSSAPTFSEGNLKSISANAKFGGSSTIGLTSGKWYLEAKSIEDSTIRNTIGISGEVSELARGNKSPTDGGATNSSVAYQAEGGNKYINSTSSSYGATYGNGDIIGIAIDLDSGTKTVKFYKNNADQGAITIPTAVSSTTDGAYFICHGSSGASPSTFEFNFGSPPYAISSGNADGDGFGNFEFAPPSGFFALCTKNLAEYG